MCNKYYPMCQLQSKTQKRYENMYACLRITRENYSQKHRLVLFFIIIFIIILLLFLIIIFYFILFIFF